MFEIGFWELALLFALGLIVLGPEKLPRVAAQLGRYAGQARRMARTLGNQIRDELEAEESRARETRRHHPPAADTDIHPDVEAGIDADTEVEAAADAQSGDAAATRTPAGDKSEQQELDLKSAPEAAPARPVYSRPGVDDLIPKGERTADVARDEVAETESRYGRS